MLVGDDRQLPEFDAGGGFRGLAERLGAVELHETRRQSREWDREALAALRSGEIERWAGEYRERGRLVARSTAREVRDTLVSDWWRSARVPETDAVMIAHRRTDVADLNGRARELMRVDRRLGEEELVAAERSFAEGDRVIAKHNARRLSISNGERGRVAAVDVDRQTVTVTLDGGREVTVDAAYLEDGHLDHGYALTAHAAQGATVDTAFVLGSDDLYREWGYTAMTRHRAEARFYLVSPGSVERCLPGLEPETDLVVDDVAEMLEQTRQKSLAVDLLADHPAIAQAARERALAEDARRDAEQRLEMLREQQAALSLFRRGRRAELELQVELQLRAVDHWQAELETLYSRRMVPTPHSDSRASGGPDEAQTLEELRVVVVAAEDRLTHAVGPRPEMPWAREPWVADAMSWASSELDVDLGPAVEFAPPDLDFGP